MKNKLITIGTDPEAFLFDKTLKKVVTSIGIVPGDKNEPFELEKGINVLKDNALIEFNTRPVSSISNFIKEIDYCKKLIKNVILKDRYEMIFKPSNIFCDEDLKDPFLQIFGCETDFNVYTRSVNEVPDSSTNLRSAGGHIHIGFKHKAELNYIEKVVKSLDLFISVPLLNVDKDSERRKLYGKAGCFRIKPYGLEYRTPSNFWLNSDKYIEFIYNKVEEAIDFANSYSLSVENEELIRNCINNNSIELIEKVQDLVHLKKIA